MSQINFKIKDDFATVMSRGKPCMIKLLDNSNKNENGMFREFILIIKVRVWH